MCVSSGSLLCLCVVCGEREREREKRYGKKEPFIGVLWPISLSSSEMLDAAAGYK